MQYDRNKKVSLLSAPIPIKSIPDEKRSSIKSLRQVLGRVTALVHILFCTSFSNGSSQIQGVDFDQSYRTVTHYYPFTINIYISALHNLDANIVDVINYSHNKKYLIHEIFCDSPLPYYLDYFETLTLMFL